MGPNQPENLGLRKHFCTASATQHDPSSVLHSVAADCLMAWSSNMEDCQSQWHLYTRFMFVVVKSTVETLEADRMLIGMMF